MNRRSFLTSMLAAAVAPQFLKGAGRLWAQKELLWVPNPEWVNAPYEQSFYFPFGSKFVCLYARTDEITPSHIKFIRDPYPRRFNAYDLKNPIPPFILA